MAVVQRVIEDTGADTDTFCKWLMSSRVTRYMIRL